MQRLRLYDLRTSRLPSVVGKCQSDVPAIANYVNSAQRRLLMCKEAADDGWWGTWAEIVFNVSRDAPYITLPREVARLELMDICNKPVFIQNQFFEYLNFGNGRMPQCRNSGTCWQANGYTRNNAITFVEMTSAPQYVTVYLTDDRDVGKRILFSGLDANENTIYSTDVANQVTGVFLTLTSPSVQSPMTFAQIQGIQKDVTYGIVRIYQHDPTTGDEVLLLTMQPGETTAMYRRYYLDRLPQGCCVAPGNTDATLVQVTAIAKLDLIPVVTDTDYTLIQNLEALIEECNSIRYSEMDSPAAKQMSADRHKVAIGLLNGELAHYIGKNSVAVGFHPFGAAHLRRSRIGRLW